MRIKTATSMWNSALIGALAVIAIAASANAQHPIPESERWATITHAGNAPYTVLNSNGDPSRYVGQVNYEYQISRTEVTGAEWFEFVQAYAPYVDEDGWSDPYFRSSLIAPDGYRQYRLPPANANRAVDVGWHYAARYINWLHNGKALTPEAFENGAYDTSTFGEHPGGGWTDQITHSPGATYWIPSVDEWTKAAFFDPNRYGEAMPGYWLYPHSSDILPLFGSPANGGETSAVGSWTFALPDVAAYRDVQSPWGLWDCSGGRAEWTEDVEYSQFATGYNHRRIQGSDWRDDFYSSVDRVDSFRTRTPLWSVGLRVARAVPGPFTAGVFVCALSLMTRRRRLDDTLQPDRDRFAAVRSRPAVH